MLPGWPGYLQVQPCGYCCMKRLMPSPALESQVSAAVSRELQKRKALTEWDIRGGEFHFGLAAYYTWIPSSEK